MCVCVRESPETKTNNFGNTRKAVFNSFNFYGPFCKSQLRLYLTLKTKAFVAGLSVLLGYLVCSLSLRCCNKGTNPFLDVL